MGLVLTAIGFIGAVHAIDCHVASIMRRYAKRFVEHVLTTTHLACIAFGRCCKQINIIIISKCII